MKICKILIFLREHLFVINEFLNVVTSSEPPILHFGAIYIYDLILYYILSHYKLPVTI